MGRKEFKRLLKIADKEVRPDPKMVEYVKERTRIRAKEEGVMWSEKSFEEFIRKYVINAKLPVKPRLFEKIPYRDIPPTSKGTNLLLTLSHAPSTSTGFRGERSLDKTFPRTGKRRATFRTCQAL